MQPHLQPLMIKKTFLFVFFIFLACDVSSEKILINNVNVIDPLDGITKKTNVEISNNKISSVGKKTSIFYSKKIDGSGKYLIPGLWDSHVHLYFDQELAKDMPMLFLKFGITSIRDTGGDFNFLDSIKKLSEKYPKSYPRLKISGPLIDGKFNVYNGERLPNLSVKTENVKETENVVNKLIHQELLTQ